MVWPGWPLPGGGGAGAFGLCRAGEGRVEAVALGGVVSVFAFAAGGGWCLMGVRAGPLVGRCGVALGVTESESSRETSTASRTAAKRDS